MIRPYASTFAQKEQKKEVHLWASGSEVHLAVRVADDLEERDICARVISVPCLELFLEKSSKKPTGGDESAGSKDLLHAPGLHVAIEAGSSWGWHRVVGKEGLVCSVDDFGHSGPYAQVQRHFGLEVESIRDRVLSYFRSAL